MTSYDPSGLNQQQTNTVPVVNIIQKDPLEFKRAANKLLSASPSSSSSAQLPLAQTHQPEQIPITVVKTSSDSGNESEEFFSKTIASYLKELSRRHKIKAKIEMMQILEKYIDIEENEKRGNFFKF